MRARQAECGSSALVSAPAASGDPLYAAGTAVLSPLASPDCVGEAGSAELGARGRGLAAAEAAAPAPVLDALVLALALALTGTPSAADTATDKAGFCSDAACDCGGTSDFSTAPVVLAEAAKLPPRMRLLRSGEGAAAEDAAASDAAVLSALAALATSSAPPATAARLPRSLVLSLSASISESESESESL